MMNLRLFTTIFVVLFATNFGAQFVFLAHGDVINNYPFISPDGFDWYTEGIYLTQFFSGVTLPELPVLRPPLFVFLTALDFILGNKGFVIAIVYAFSIFCTYFCSLKLVDVMHGRAEKNSWYIVPLAISATIYPLNFFKPFLLADSLAVALSLASVLLLVKHYTSSEKHHLALSSTLAILAGLTQTYALIPFLASCAIAALLLFKSDKKRALHFITLIFVVSFIFIILIAIWRGVLPHGTTPKNFDLLSFSIRMSEFYLNTWSYYFLPLIVFFILCRKYSITTSTSSLISLSSASLVLLLGTLAFFYQWPDARFTFYLWPWLLILFFSSVHIKSVKASYLFVILMAVVVVIVPANYWEPTWKSMHISSTHNWLANYFSASPIDRKLNDCKDSDCGGKNEFLNNSDQYIHRTINIYIQLRQNLLMDPKIAQKYEGKIVHRPWFDGSKDDGWYFVSKGARQWITDGKWLEKNGFDQKNNIEISAKELNAIPENPEPLKP